MARLKDNERVTESEGSAVEQVNSNERENLNTSRIDKRYTCFQ